MVNYFQRILQRKRVKNGFQVVKAISSFAENVKTEIDFAIGEKDQVRILGFGVSGWRDRELFTLKASFKINLRGEPEQP